MKVSTRKRLLLAAAWLDRRSAAIRKYVKAKTPKRIKKAV